MKAASQLLCIGTLPGVPMAKRSTIRLADDSANAVMSTSDTSIQRAVRFADAIGAKYGNTPLVSMRHHDLNDPQDEDALAVTTLAKIRVFGLPVSGLPEADALDEDLIRLAAEDHGIAFAFYMKDEQDVTQAQIFLEESTDLYSVTLNADDAPASESDAHDVEQLIDLDQADEDSTVVALYSAPSFKYNLVDTANDVLLEAGFWEEASDDEVQEAEEADGEFAEEQDPNVEEDADESGDEDEDDDADTFGEDDDGESDEVPGVDTADLDALDDESLLDLALASDILSDDEVDELTTAGLTEDRRAELISELRNIDEFGEDAFDEDDPEDDGRLVKRATKADPTVAASLTVVDVIPSIVLNLVIPSVGEFEKNEVELLKSYENRDYSLPIRRAAQKRASGSLIAPLMYVIDEMDSLIQRSAYVQSGLESQFTNMLRNSLTSRLEAALYGPYSTRFTDNPNDFDPDQHGPIVGDFSDEDDEDSDGPIVSGVSPVIPLSDLFNATGVVIDIESDNEVDSYACAVINALVPGFHFFKPEGASSFLDMIVDSVRETMRMCECHVYVAVSYNSCDIMSSEVLYNFLGAVRESGLVLNTITSTDVAQFHNLAVPGENEHNMLSVLMTKTENSGKIPTFLFSGDSDEGSVLFEGNTNTAVFLDVFEVDEEHEEEVEEEVEEE